MLGGQEHLRLLPNSNLRAHEMVHHKQFEDGRLEVKPPDIGGEIEDEANAKAGQFIKMYSKEDPTIYDL